MRKNRESISIIFFKKREGRIFRDMSNVIPLNEVRYSSFRRMDDVGVVFYWKERLFRGIYNDKVKYVHELFEGGLIEELESKNLMPHSWISNLSIEGYGLVIEHERISDVSFPYEWSFSMLKEAALCILKVNEIANEYGYQTKDSHGYNIVFKYHQAQFVDLGSFVKRENNLQGWLANQEFIQFYYYVLKIWSKGDLYLPRRILSYPFQFLPHESFYLWKSRVCRWLGVKRLKNWFDKWYGLKSLHGVENQRILEKNPFGLGDQLVQLKERKLLPFQKFSFRKWGNKICRLKYNPPKTSWAYYHGGLLDENGNIKSTERFDRILEITKELKVNKGIELGGNRGVFSALLLNNEYVQEMVCTDYDEAAVELMYNLVKEKNLKIYPAVLDFVNPILTEHRPAPSLRMQGDAVFVLAVTHHLVLTQKIPLKKIFEIVKTFTREYVFIEFMPKGMYNSKLNPNPIIPEWYHQDWFRNEFKKQFELILEEQLDYNRVLFLGRLK